MCVCERRGGGGEGVNGVNGWVCYTFLFRRRGGWGGGGGLRRRGGEEKRRRVVSEE